MVSAFNQQREANQFRHAANVQLLHQAAAMFFNRFDAQAELAGHDLVRIAGDDEPHDVVLAIGEGVNFVRGVGPFLGVLVSLAAFRDIAADRLEFDQLTFGIEQGPMRPMFPHDSAIGATVAMFMHDDRILDRKQTASFASSASLSSSTIDDMKLVPTSASAGASQ